MHTSLFTASNREAERAFWESDEADKLTTIGQRIHLVEEGQLVQHRIADGADPQDVLLVEYRILKWNPEHCQVVFENIPIAGVSGFGPTDTNTWGLYAKTSRRFLNEFPEGRIEIEHIGTWYAGLETDDPDRAVKDRDIEAGGVAEDPETLPGIVLSRFRPTGAWVVVFSECG